MTRNFTISSRQALVLEYLANEIREFTRHLLRHKYILLKNGKFYYKEKQTGVRLTKRIENNIITPTNFFITDLLVIILNVFSL